MQMEEDVQRTNDTSGNRKIKLIAFIQFVFDTTITTTNMNKTFT